MISGVWGKSMDRGWSNDAERKIMRRPRVQYQQSKPHTNVDLG